MSRKTGRQKRLQLYDRGNVACPICFSPFTREMVFAGRQVTLEHVPPKFTGGRARCLTCRTCNAGTGRGVDQAAAIASRPTKVTVDVMGKRGAFTLADDGKPITTPFRQFDARDFANAPGFTMSVGIADPRAVAASFVKAAYLAMFSLLGPIEGYGYVRGSALQAIRDRILNPLRYDDFGRFVLDAPTDTPTRDIFLVEAPVPCWVVKTPARAQERFVVLPLVGDSATGEPLWDWSKRVGASTVQIVGSAAWTFQTFGVLRTVRVHLAGADRMGSLVGRTIRGILPDGRPERGICIRHVGENATLLCTAPDTRRNVASL